MVDDDAPAPADAPTETPRPRRRAVPQLPRGTCVGRYVLIDVIGAGGMGVVYRAYDPELDRRIALKLVREGRTAPTRLIEEAQALARVSHPNVVAVHDVGTIDDQVFIAMELVEGRTLHQWRTQTAPSRKRLLEVFLAAGRGLAAAHKAGIVHRDFKPSNVIVGDDGRVRVADFGLARAGDVSTIDRTPGATSTAAAPASAAGSTPRQRPAVVTGGSTENDAASAGAGAAGVGADARARASGSGGNGVRGAGAIGATGAIDGPGAAGTRVDGDDEPTSATVVSDGDPGGDTDARDPRDRDARDDRDRDPRARDPRDRARDPRDRDRRDAATARATDADPAGLADPDGDLPLDGDDAQIRLDGATAVDTVAGLPRVVASRVMGTPSYMAPEQRRTGVYDARVDQYAFGVALYEHLYGERPFAGATANELAVNAAAERVRPPPKGSDVPAHLRRVLLRALRADPADRFPSMDAMLEALADDPIARRRRRVAIGAALGLLLLAAWGLYRRGRAADPCDDAGAALGDAWDGDVAARVDRALRATGRTYAPAIASRATAELGARADEWQHARRAACVAHARGDASDDLFDREDACLDRRAGELRALAQTLARGPDPELLDHALDAVAALPAIAACADRDALLAVPLPADPTARTRVAALRGQLAQVDAQAWTGAYLAARDRAAALVHDAEATGYAPVVAEALLSAGRAARRAADFAHAEPLLYDAAAHAASARDDALAAEAWVEAVGVVGYDLARPAEGAALARAAAAAVERAGAPAALRARLLHAQALVASITGATDDAIAREREALALREEGGDDVAIAESVNDLARLTSMRGDYVGAEALHRRALALREKALGDAHPLTADSLDNLGVVLEHEGRYPEARGFLEQSLARRTAALGPDARDVGTTLNNLGALALDTGDDAAAADFLARALATWEKALGPEHPDLAIPLSNLGDLANKQGDHARAAALCKRALAIEEKAEGADNPDLAYNLVCLGEASLGTGAVADARAPLERALALREKAPTDAGELARTRFDVAQLLSAAHDDPARARRLATQACQGFDTLGGPWATRKAACDAWLTTH